MPLVPRETWRRHESCLLPHRCGYSSPAILREYPACPQNSGAPFRRVPVGGTLTLPGIHHSSLHSNGPRASRWFVQWPECCLECHASSREFSCTISPLLKPSSGRRIL